MDYILWKAAKARRQKKGIILRQLQSLDAIDILIVYLETLS